MAERDKKEQKQNPAPTKEQQCKTLVPAVCSRYSKSRPHDLLDFKVEKPFWRSRRLKGQDALNEKESDNALKIMKQNLAGHSGANVRKKRDTEGLFYLEINGLDNEVLKYFDSMRTKFQVEMEEQERERRILDFEKNPTALLEALEIYIPGSEGQALQYMWVPEAFHSRLWVTSFFLQKGLQS